MSQKPPRPIHEIKAELSKSAHKNHTLQYVFVEGVDDVKIYSEIARKKNLATKLTFEHQGGRIQLLKLHETISSDTNLLNKTIFFADKDTFVLTSIPSIYETIYFTKGYSIENDLFEDGHDFLMNELSDDEKTRFEKLINSVSEWYAYEIEQILANKSSDSKIAIKGLNPDTITPNGEQLEAIFLTKRGYIEANQELSQQIKDDYKLLLRGKILFEILLRISFDRGGIHHKEIPTMWNIAITEGLRNKGSNCGRIVDIFQNKLLK